MIDHLAYYASIAMDKILASSTDGLTQVYSRAYLDKELPNRIEYLIRHKRPFSVVMGDIDHFKNVNDSLGHQFGDAVLKEVGGIFNVGVRRNVDVVGRYGGEEFSLFFPEVSKKNVYEIVDGLRKKIGSSVVSFGGKKKSVSASFGVYSMSFKDYAGLSPKQALDLAVKDADIALYFSKEEFFTKLIVALFSTFPTMLQLICAGADVLI
jgi:diguanylate cyclase (GGDEF)-like protein